MQDKSEGIETDGPRPARDEASHVSAPRHPNIYNGLFSISLQSRPGCLFPILLEFSHVFGDHCPQLRVFYHTG